MPLVGVGHPSPAVPGRMVAIWSQFAAVVARPATRPAVCRHRIRGPWGLRRYPCALPCRHGLKGHDHLLCARRAPAAAGAGQTPATAARQKSLPNSKDGAPSRRSSWSCPAPCRGLGRRAQVASKLVNTRYRACSHLLGCGETATGHCSLVTYSLSNMKTPPSRPDGERLARSRARGCFVASSSALRVVGKGSGVGGSAWRQVGEQDADLGDGARLPVQRDQQGRRAQPHRRYPHRLQRRLAVS